MGVWKPRSRSMPERSSEASSPGIDGLRRRFESLADIPEGEWRFFQGHLLERTFTPGQRLLREGQYDPTVFFVVEGLLRLYHTRDGIEQVRGFDYEGRFTGSYESLLTGGPCAFSIEALERTRTLSFSGEILTTLYERHPCWDRVMRRMLEMQWVRHQDKERRFRLYDAEEHYRLLLEREPAFLHRVPLHQVASYLGITPETLSRVRSRIRRDGELPSETP